MYRVTLLFFTALSCVFADSLTPKEFSGLWYEIARTDNPYEKNCVAATVEYRLKDTNSFEVTNRCFENIIGGKLIEYNGKAKTLRENSAHKLQLTYFWFFSDQYNLIHVDPTKQYAVMADDTYQYIWIMSRTPQIPKTSLHKALKKIASVTDTKRLIFTPQDPTGKYK